MDVSLPFTCFFFQLLCIYLLFFFGFLWSLKMSNTVMGGKGYERQCCEQRMKRKRKPSGKRSQNTQEKNEMTLAVCKRAYFERIKKKKKTTKTSQRKQSNSSALNLLLRTSELRAPSRLVSENRKKKKPMRKPRRSRRNEKKKRSIQALKEKKKRETCWRIWKRQQQ